jgi:hypothetical protein
MSSKIRGHARIAMIALALGVFSAAPVKASTVNDNISFTDVGTYQVSGAGFYNGTAVASASFLITFDPTQLYLTQSITGFITNLVVSVTDNRFSPANLTFNNIAYFAFDGAGTLTLSSNSALSKNLIGTPDITIGVNGWAYTPGSAVWYSQTGFNDTLTTSGDVSILQTRGSNQSETPLPAALPLFATGLGALGLLAQRRKRKAAAIAVA